MAKKSKVEIIAADEGSAENELGFTAEEAEILALPDASPPSRSTDTIGLGGYGDPKWMEDDEPTQSPESAALDAEIASGGNARIAVIPVVDRVVDPVVVRGPIDVRIGGNHIKNPG